MFVLEKKIFPHRFIIGSIKIYQKLERFLVIAFWQTLQWALEVRCCTSPRCKKRNTRVKQPQWDLVEFNITIQPRFQAHHISAFLRCKPHQFGSPDPLVLDRSGKRRTSGNLWGGRILGVLWLGRLDQFGVLWDIRNRPSICLER